MPYVAVVEAEDKNIWVEVVHGPVKTLENYNIVIGIKVRL
jgi:hypothetical protein